MIKFGSTGKPPCECGAADAEWFGEGLRVWCCAKCWSASNAQLDGMAIQYERAQRSAVKKAGLRGALANLAAIGLTCGAMLGYRACGLIVVLYLMYGIVGVVKLTRLFEKETPHG